MCAQHLSATDIRDLIPFIPRLKEMFLKWAALKDYSCVRLKLIVEHCENPEIQPIFSAFEQWNDLQNDGAPGVEMESVYCEMNIVRRIEKSCATLNEMILNVANIKNTGDFI